MSTPQDAPETVQQGQPGAVELVVRDIEAIAKRINRPKSKEPARCMRGPYGLRLKSIIVADLQGADISTAVDLPGTTIEQIAEGALLAVENDVLRGAYMGALTALINMRGAHDESIEAGYHETGAPAVQYGDRSRVPDPSGDALSWRGT